MKAETADYLAKARATLADAQQIAAAPLPHVAAREAYLAVFHATEAYIFEQTGKVAKTHRGVRSEFARLARAEPRIGRDLVTFFGAAYQFKTRACHRLDRNAVDASRGDRRYCDGGALHRRHNARASAGTDAAARAARAAVRA